MRHFEGYLDRAGQCELLREIRAVIAEAPLFTPAMPRTGKPFSVAMTNCGSLGWVSDRTGGYRYQETHPVTGKPWPAMPERVLEIWRKLADYPASPEACLINYYRPGARLGLHRDEDEIDFSAPVISVSLGMSARFRLGGRKRRDPTKSLTLDSGDVVILAGPTRLAYHGIDRILPGNDDLVEEGGRFNLTLRRVNRLDMA